jgi:deoxyguanosine kinase
MEQQIAPDYLQRLSDAYAEHFRREAPKALFVVVTDRFNPVERDADFERLLQRLEAFHGGVEVLDPSPGATLA